MQVGIGDTSSSSKFNCICDRSTEQFRTRARVFSEHNTPLPSISPPHISNSRTNMNEQTSFARVFLTLFLLIYVASITSSMAQSFRCSSAGTCNALIDYVSPNTTTLSAIQNLFGVQNLPSLLGANNFPLSTSPNQTVSAKQTVKIPFRCLCTNGTGMSNHQPLYKVVSGDGLYHIAAEVFSGLVTFTQIQAVNNVHDANLIIAGQELWIPLPCSCDDVDNERVVHYGHVVANGSTVEGIALQYNSSADTLLKLNGLASPNDLMAGSVLDVPLKACTSMVSNHSLDYPLLVSNGTYAFTATNCVMCKCDPANNWLLQCEPSQLNSTNWQSCPVMQCQGTNSLYLGNTTSTACNRTTCAYAGYNNQTIITTLDVESTCPVHDNSALKFILIGWNCNSLLISIHLVLLLHHLFQ